MTIDRLEAALFLVTLAVCAYRYAAGRWPVAVDVDTGEQ
jgi:hypothetical protein